MCDYGVLICWGEFEIFFLGSGECSEWMFGFVNEQQCFGGCGFEQVIDGIGMFIERCFECRFEEFDFLSFFGLFIYESESGNVFNFIGVLQSFFYFEWEFFDQFGLNFVDLVLWLCLLCQSEDEVSYELGVDYEMVLGFGCFKWIGLYCFEFSFSEVSVCFDFVDD